MNLFAKLIKTGHDHIGIDIGTHSVKAVELASEKGVFGIKNIGYAKINGANSPESVAEAVKEAVSSAKISQDRDVAVAMPGSSVIVRFIALPRMSEDELRTAITFEAEKYIPFAVSDVIIDHQMLTSGLSGNKMLVLLIAAKKDAVNERLELISHAGISAYILDVASLANVNAFLASAKRDKGELAAVINVGAKSTDISIVSEDVLYFTRSVQIGGNDITQSLAEHFSMNFKEAEELKLNPKDKAAEIGEITKNVLGTIVEEARLSFSYYENQSGRSIEKVYLEGGAANSANMGEMLKENLGAAVMFWDPAASMALYPSADSRLAESLKYQLGTAVGLAMR